MNRPAGLAAMRAALARFETAEGVAMGLAFRPRPTDIFIAPYAKCGTTWMQQIVHGLRTGGDMAFGEITEVVPWIELAHDLGLDPEAPQPEPRAYKSHLPWDEIPKGGRYIVVLRDPVDAMVSLYRFFEGWFFEPGSIGLAEFADDYLARGEGGWWHHAASWWRRRGRDDTLLLAYENMASDLAAHVARVDAFIGTGADAATLETAIRQATLGFMKAHAGQFDDNLVRRRRDAVCGLPPGGASAKVAGGPKPEISPEIRARFAERWKRTMEAEFGLPGYDALRRALVL